MRWLQPRPLQIAVGVACLVPLLAGGAGAFLGAAAFGDPNAPISSDSHVRYLSGRLLGIGLVFVSMIPAIERNGRGFRMLTFLVAVGGLARLYGIVTAGVPGPPMLFGLAMELVVTPLLCLWQAAVARHSVSPALDPG